MHPCSVCALPADPDVLDDVLGVGNPAQHPIRDPEQARTNALEVHRFLGHVGCGHRRDR